MLLDRDKGFGVNAFELDFRLILNQPLQQGYVVVANAFYGVRNQHLRRWQRMMGTGADFGENEVLMLEGDPVTVGGDVHVKRIVFALVNTAIAQLKQFGVKRSAEEVKAEVGNFWSNR